MMLVLDLFAMRQNIFLFIDIEEVNWPVYRENWPKTDTIEDATHWPQCRAPRWSMNKPLRNAL
jgi:hypothetical protein